MTTLEKIKAEFISRYPKNYANEPELGGKSCVFSLNDVLHIIDKYATDIVSRGVLEQVMWERDIAIEQLHELGYELGQKIEPCDDVVSRQAIMKLKRHNLVEGQLVSLYDIEKLPSVRPQEPKTGKWIKNHDKRCWWYECSECGNEPLKNKWNGDDELSAFCPNCGADMRKESR